MNEQRRRDGRRDEGVMGQCNPSTERDKCWKSGSERRKRRRKRSKRERRDENKIRRKKI